MNLHCKIDIDVEIKGGIGMYTTTLAEKVVEFYRNPENMKKFREWQKKRREEEQREAANAKLVADDVPAAGGAL